MGVKAFATDVRACLIDHLSEAEVSFRGSFARGDFDELSDVDLEASIVGPLTGLLFMELEACLAARYGPALVRYDPDFSDDLTAQGVRFSFYRLPVFWRVDLILRSCKVADEKWPSPFPEWQVGTSALMNVIWAVKCHRRGNVDANQYLASACHKMGLSPMQYSTPACEQVLRHLDTRDDVDRRLLDALAATVRQ
jgi:hypothetical protein